MSAATLEVVAVILGAALLNYRWFLRARRANRRRAQLARVIEFPVRRRDPREAA